MLSDLDLNLIMTPLKLKYSIIDSAGREFSSDGALSLVLLAGVELATVLCDLDDTMYYYSLTWPWIHAIFAHVGSSHIPNLRRAGGRGTPTPIVQRQDETLD
ncbi:hypothetical protein FA13DRAFT_1799356 [Coprinellus micaceus]|uniref:Uncharacterized protein n=1 Tax=Coprinellus micaceus TaxID=71717 RepID=A0A4Y7SJ28_COPMI|nr:hypothetical protein FA13DRAFT_1799356 [Coprinellus micaceus]